MQIITFRTLLLSLFLSISFFGYASDKEPTKDDSFDTKVLIFHHIKDSHGFHVAGDISIPLPVILWTDNGLVTFMSSESSSIQRMKLVSYHF